MKIAISGTHSTGKSTFVEKLRFQIEARGASCGVVPSIARNCPIPTLRSQDGASTLWIVCHSISLELETAHKYDCVIVDRCVVDPIAYYRVAQQENRDANFQMALNLATDWVETYDALIKSHVDYRLPIQDDGHRDTDPEYRRLVDQELDRTFELLAIQPISLTTEHAETVTQELAHRATLHH